MLTSRPLLVVALLLPSLAVINHLPCLQAQEDTGNEEASPPQFPKIIVSKETTYVTGPVREDGTVDFAAAINQILGEGVTPENNANVRYWQAFGPHPERATMPPEFFELMGIEPLPEEGDYFVNLGEFARKFLGEAGDRAILDNIYDQQGTCTTKPWKAADHPVIAGWITKNEAALDLVVDGSKRPKFYSPLVIPADDDFGLVGVLLPGIQSMRSFARALTARAMLRAGEGKVEEAWQDLLACHRIGRQLGTSATLVESLVGIAIGSMATNSTSALLDQPMTAQQIGQIQQDLKGLPPIPPVWKNVDLGERMMFLDSASVISKKGLNTFVDLAGVDRAPIPDFLVKMAGRATDWNVTMRMGNKYYDRFVKIMKIDNRSLRKQQMAQMEKELDELKDKVTNPRNLGLSFLSKKPSTVIGEAMGNILISLMLPAVSATTEAQDRISQQYEVLDTAVALKSYHQDYGKYPKRLADLVEEDYLKAMPIDRYTEQPLVYKPTAKGFTLYSVGRNEQDDDGRSFDDEPAGDDLVVKLKQ